NSPSMAWRKFTIATMPLAELLGIGFGGIVAIVNFLHAIEGEFGRSERTAEQRPAENNRQDENHRGESNARGLPARGDLPAAPAGVFVEFGRLKFGDGPHGED